MSNRFIVCVGVFSLFFVFCGRCGKKSVKLQSLHREIGNNLIKIKKKHPQSQTLIYSLLDQVGEYYAFSSGLLQNKKRYKKLLQDEIASNELLTKNLDELKVKMDKAKKAILSVHKKMQSDSARADVLEKEKEDLEREREEFLREKSEFESERDTLRSQRDALIEERNALLRDNSKEPHTVEAKSHMEKPVTKKINRGVFAKSAQKQELLVKKVNA